MSTTLGSSIPALVTDGFSSLMPRIFLACTTSLSSAIVATGFWTGCGAGSRGSNAVGMQIGDILLHMQSTNTAFPGRVTLHACIGSTANFSSTTASSGHGAAYDVTVSNSTST